MPPATNLDHLDRLAALDRNATRASALAAVERARQQRTAARADRRAELACPSC